VVGLYTEGDGGLAHLGQPQRIGWVLPPHAEAPLPAGLAPAPASVFAEQVALLGHQLQPQAGGVAVTLYWQTQRLPAADYAVFAHLIQGDAIVAQYDGSPGGSAAPTGGWLPGQRFSTQVTLVPPAGVRLGGVYQVRVGLYDPVSGARLAVQDAQGGLVGDSVVLGEITITP
jgi:hypothetical protein